MSAYELNRFAYELREAAAREEFTAEPDGYLANYDLEPAERDLIAGREWEPLIDAGVSVYVLANYARTCGLDFGQLGAALRGETPEQMAAFVAAQTERCAPFAILPEAENG